MRNHKHLYLLILGLIIPFTSTSCSGPQHKVNRIADYIYEVPTYTELDYKFANDYFKDNYNNWDKEAQKQGGGCSAIWKKIKDENGDLVPIVGRNMDLNISNKCAYIVRTDAGKYKTFGLAYTFRDISPDYEIVKKSDTIDDKFYKLLPFMCDDIMNDQGLYIEINMRTGEYGPSGEDKFACKGTNPNAETKVYMFELIRYIAENCANVGEAYKFLINDVNIYSKKYYWNYAFLIADKNKAQVFEFSHDLLYDVDRVYQLEYEQCQTNFYLNAYSSKYQEIVAGKGRYDKMKDGIGEVTNEKQMYELMKSVSYYQVYKGRDCQFDPRSENIGAIPAANYDIVMDPANKEIILDLITNFGKDVLKLTREEQQKQNCYWESSFTEVNCPSKGYIKVRFFENENLIYKITQEKTEESSF